MGPGAQACRGQDQLAEQLADCGKTIVARWKSYGQHVSANRRQLRRMLKKFVQQGRRRVETGGVPSGVVEDFDEPRTKQADFFSILLGFGLAVIKMPMLPVEPGMAQFVGKNVAPSR